MRKIIFDYELDGHNLEYLHHIYMGAIEESSNDFFFLLPSEFNEIKNLFEWPSTNNVFFNFFDNNKITKKSPIITAWNCSRLLNNVSKEIKADEILLIWMMSVVPFIGLFINKNIKVSGIIYRIYLYSWKYSSLKTKILNVIKYCFIIKTSCISKVFVLNDASAVSTLNKIWKTNKFKYLADPYVPFDSKDIRDLRNELGVVNEKKIILHMGAMSTNKGTIDVLNMIENSPKDVLDNYCFIFAGKIYPDIKNVFYDKVNSLEKKVQIIVKDKFLPYDYMGSLVYTCDKVLLPYKRVDMSSGSIAYAAQFNKSVYVPRKGLLGKLVRRYSIGINVSDFKDISCLNIENSNSNSYCTTHTIKHFLNSLLS